jgi:hypothetical protein
MNTATLMILLSMQDQATPKLQSFGTVLQKNQVAIRQLGAGVATLGTALLGMSVALKNVNNPMAQSIGNTIQIIGGMMAAVGAAASFIASIGKIKKAIDALIASQILQKALSGPAGWATLAAGLAVAGGVSYAASQKSSGSTTNITNNIQGSVVTEKQLAENVRKQIIAQQSRNVTSGIK